MNTIMELDDLERRVLANLNEAGEDYVSALLNSVVRCAGKETEPAQFVRALRRLFEFGLVEFATRRDENTLQ